MNSIIQEILELREKSGRPALTGTFNDLVGAPEFFTETRVPLANDQKRDLVALKEESARVGLGTKTHTMEFTNPDTYDTSKTLKPINQADEIDYFRYHLDDYDLNDAAPFSHHITQYYTTQMPEAATLTADKKEWLGYVSNQGTVYWLSIESKLVSSVAEQKPYAEDDTVLTLYQVSDDQLKVIAVETNSKRLPKEFEEMKNSQYGQKIEKAGADAVKQKIPQAKPKAPFQTKELVDKADAARITAKKPLDEANSTLAIFKSIDDQYKIPRLKEAESRLKQRIESAEYYVNELNLKVTTNWSGRNISNNSDTFAAESNVINRMISNLSKLVKSIESDRKSLKNQNYWDPEITYKNAVNAYNDAAKQHEKAVRNPSVDAFTYAEKRYEDAAALFDEYVILEKAINDDKSYVKKSLKYDHNHAAEEATAKAKAIKEVATAHNAVTTEMIKTLAEKDPTKRNALQTTVKEKINGAKSKAVVADTYFLLDPAKRAVAASTATQKTPEVVAYEEMNQALGNAEKIHKMAKSYPTGEVYNRAAQAYSAAENKVEDYKTALNKSANDTNNSLSDERRAAYKTVATKVGKKATAVAAAKTACEEIVALAQQPGTPDANEARRKSADATTKAREMADFEIPSPDEAEKAVKKVTDKEAAEAAKKAAAASKAAKTASKAAPAPTTTKSAEVAAYEEAVKAYDNAYEAYKNAYNANLSGGLTPELCENVRVAYGVAAKKITAYQKAIKAKYGENYKFKLAGEKAEQCNQVKESFASLAVAVKNNKNIQKQTIADIKDKVNYADGKKLRNPDQDRIDAFGEANTAYVAAVKAHLGAKEPVIAKHEAARDAYENAAAMITAYVDAENEAGNTAIAEAAKKKAQAAKATAKAYAEVVQAMEAAEGKKNPKEKQEQRDIVGKKLKEIKTKATETGDILLSHPSATPMVQAKNSLTRNTAKWTCVLLGLACAGAAARWAVDDTKGYSLEIGPLIEISDSAFNFAFVGVVLAAGVFLTTAWMLGDTNSAKATQKPGPDPAAGVGSSTPSNS